MAHIPKTWQTVLALFDQGEQTISTGYLVRHLGWSQLMASQVLDDMNKHGCLRMISDSRRGIFFVRVGEGALVPYYSTDVMKAHDPMHNPKVAALLGLIFPGLGQIYNGQVWRGVKISFGTLVMWIFIMGWIVHIWSIFDAYHVGMQIKRGDTNLKKQMEA